MIKSYFFTVQSFSRYCSSYTNAKFISDAFNLSYVEAKSYIEKNNLRQKDPELIRESVSFCKKIGYSDDDILTNPLLLSENPIAIRNHYKALEETGFRKIFPKILAKSRVYMRKEIKALKELDLMDREQNVAQNFLSYLDRTPLSKEFVATLSDNLRWTELHRIVMEAYLKTRLEATDEDIIKLFRIHKMIKNKSFRQVRENIELAEELDFTKPRILACGYLLHNYPDYPKKVLRDLDGLAGIDLRKAMRSYPKLVMIAPKKFIQIYGILKEYNIPDENIKKHPQIFQMAPETVKYRLEEIHRIPEFKVLLNHPKVLSLVVHHNKATSRLSFLQQLQLKCASVFLLSEANVEPFDDHIKSGKDVYHIKDLLPFVNNLLEDKESEIKKRLKQHPFFAQVPLLEMEKTFLFLRDRNFDKSSIAKVVWILLYPVEKVRKALYGLSSLPDIKVKQLSQIQKLNLMLYLMEKEHHFTGNGVWRKEPRKKEEESLDMFEKTLE